MLGNVPVVEVGYSGIQQYIKKKSEIENVQVKAIVFQPNCILHGSVNPENPEWLDQEIQKYGQRKIYQEFFLHYLNILTFVSPFQKKLNLYKVIRFKKRLTVKTGMFT